MIYRTFKINKKALIGLSEEDKKIIKILQGAVKGIAQVYQAQLKDGFYPKDITKKQLEAAAKKNPSILSPFTFVEQKNGLLTAVSYHQKYSTMLEPIAGQIKKAANLSSNKTFKRYLLARAQSLLDGSYREADIAWFDVKNSQIDFSIGPTERYQDKIMFLKRTYQGHIGIVNHEDTELANQIKDALYSSAKISFDARHSTFIPKKGVDVSVESTPDTAGYIADALFSGEHFPPDLDLMEQYGSKILIYRDQLKLKFEQIHYPIFKALFEKKFASKYSKDLLLKATAWNILLYELGRQLHKFIGARERLQELYGAVDEANGLVSGIDHAKHLVVKGIISQDELEAIIIIHTVWLFSDWLLYQKNKGLESYVVGDAIALNSYLASGALREQNGISWPNFSKIFFQIEELAGTLSNILQNGSYKEAQQFIERNGNPKNFEAIGKSLKNFNIKLDF